MASTTNIKDWNQDEVSKWLWKSSLGHLATKFEALKIDGPALLKMDDTFIDTRLRLNPAEKSALTGILNGLRTNSVQQIYSSTLPNAGRSPRISHSSGTSPRPRFDSDSKRIVKIQHQPQDSKQHKAEVKLGPAMELLKNCRHSGWIRKQGGSENRKGWKQRYMILRLGHLYYYEKETSFKAKGYFSIQGYRVDRCTESYKGKPFCCKIIPDNPVERTYVISTAAEHEMTKWMQEIQAEIDSYEDHVYDPVAIEEEDEDEGNYEPMDSHDIYDELEEPGYVKVGGITQPPANNIGNSHTMSASQTFPRTTSSTEVPSPHSPKRSMTTTLPQSIPPRDHSRTLPGMSSLPSSSPFVPPRSKESLAATTTTVNILEQQLPEENPYIRLIDNQSTPNPPPPPISPASPSPHPPPTDSLSHPQSRSIRRSIDNVTANNSSPVIKDRHPEYTEEEIANEDPYYIRLEQMDDLMPQYCLFGGISREEAVKLLTTDTHGHHKYTRPGTYLIRDSSHQDVLHVLSVWTGSECKHYKLFSKDTSDEKGYCLTQGKLFPTIPLLLAFYKQEDLPRSPKITLSDPYHPDDH